MENLYAQNNKQLSNVIDFIHDCWFSLSEVNFDEKASLIRISFEKEMSDSPQKVKKIFFMKRMEIAVVECVLNICDVEKYDVEDTEKIDKYDFNEIHYDKQKGVLSISTGIPLRFNIDVKRLDISVNVTSNVLYTRKVWRFL